MLPNLRFALGAILASLVLVVTVFGLATTVRLAHYTKVAPFDTTRSLAFADFGDRNPFYDPEAARRHDNMAARTDVAAIDAALERAARGAWPPVAGPTAPTPVETPAATEEPKATEDPKQQVAALPPDAEAVSEQMEAPATTDATTPASVSASIPAVQPADDPIAALIESLLVPTEVAPEPAATAAAEPVPEPPAQVANLPSPAEGATDDDAKPKVETATPDASAPKASAPKASAPKPKRKAAAKPRKKKVAARRAAPARAAQPTANTGFPISTTPLTTSTTRSSSRQSDWIFNRN